MVTHERCGALVFTTALVDPAFACEHEPTRAGVE
jgi:hypothetical protein